MEEGVAARVLTVGERGQRVREWASVAGCETHTHIHRPAGQHGRTLGQEVGPWVRKREFFFCKIWENIGPVSPVVCCDVVPLFLSLGTLDCWGGATGRMWP